MANWIEVELKIAGTLEDNEKLLLSKGFVLFYKRHSMTNYYIPPEVDETDPNLKEKCLRLRKTVRLDKTGIDKDGISLMNPKGEKGDKENLKQEKELLKKGYRLLVTDNKQDWVFLDKDFENNRIAFQLQDIAGIGLILAYDNKHYYGKDNQKQLLINDIENAGIQILNYENVDRLAIIKNKNRLQLSFTEVVETLNNEKRGL